MGGIRIRKGESEEEFEIRKNERTKAANLANKERHLKKKEAQLRELQFGKTDTQSESEREKVEMAREDNVELPASFAENPDEKLYSANDLRKTIQNVEIDDDEDDDDSAPQPDENEEEGDKEPDSPTPPPSPKRKVPHKVETKAETKNEKQEPKPKAVKPKKEPAAQKPKKEPAAQKAVKPKKVKASKTIDEDPGDDDNADEESVPEAVEKDFSKALAAKEAKKQKAKAGPAASALKARLNEGKGVF